jgi:putative membrane-bound dehydrogenase-like protein
MRYLPFALVLVIFTTAFAEDFHLTARSRQGDEVTEKPLTWDPSKTAVIICDMWDQHWCKGATERCGQIAPRINDLINTVRAKGGLIVHAPSDTMKTYEGASGRKLAQAAPKAPSSHEIGKWRYLQIEKEGKLPIDDSDGGCDDQPQCKNYRAWKGEHPAIKIADGDAISDSGQEIYNLLKQRGITNVIMCGVHTNMCVLGRSFGIREMVGNGFNTVLVRDLTDTMYNPRMAPFVPHWRGTDLVIAHVEKNWCPSILSSDILGDAKPPHVVMAIDEQEYHAKETMPEFAKSELEKLGLKITILQSDDTKNLPGTEAIPSADLLILFMRRTTLPDEQLNRFKAHFNEGRPVVAVRTGSHSFQNFLEIDKKVLGVAYGNHFGNKDGTDVTPNPKLLDHPILRGVSPLEFHSTASLYKLNPLMDSATPLLLGKSGDNPIQPVAVINTYNGGRAFYLALGHPDDFKLPQIRKLLANGILWALDKPIPKTQKTASIPLPDAIKNAKGIDSVVETLHAPARNTNALSPQDEQKQFKLADGLAIDLIASEPAIRQPLNISFDERGRMWVVQYIQYPYPAGLKVVEYDRYIRAKFDKVPPPPPNNFKGADKITILEDEKGDGSFSKIKTFVDGLSIATSCLVGRGGVWVTNPPYLLFYPDKNRDDIPDGPPVVHLSGFGLEDTHAVASSLMWGPDGWIYGSQGSTCVANIKAPLSKDPEKITRFLGQAIWRYQPEEHRFEIFAEGGGNTFGVEFDDEGNLFSGTNWGQYRGVHYVQGGYYVKGWGKHGPLTNPYAFGFFGHIPHTGNADRLTHTFIVYGGGLLKAYEGKILGPNPLMSRITVTKLERDGSTFKTIEENPMMTSTDGWFRPVDLKTGPDGALYIADFYEKRISHVDPRDTWDRSTGRIWRIRPQKWEPTHRRIDPRENMRQVFLRLGDSNRLVRAQARRILTEHSEPVLVDLLCDAMKASKQNLHFEVTEFSPVIALEAFWTLYDMNALKDNDWRVALDNPSLRRWAIRLLGDNSRELPSGLSQAMMFCTGAKDLQLKSQLASSLRRIPGKASVEALGAILRHAPKEVEQDPHIPLLLWWAVEARLSTDRDAVLKMVRQNWEENIVYTVILPRLARRLASEPTPENQEALLAMLEEAMGEVERRGMLDGIAEAFKGGLPSNLSPRLADALRKWGGPELALRAGDRKALAEALKTILNDDPKSKSQTIELIQTVGQLASPEAIPILLEVAEGSQWHSVKRAALNALTHFEDPAIGKQIVSMYPRLPTDQSVRPTAISTLTTRDTWANDLLKAVAAGTIPKNDLTAEHLERIRQLEDPATTALADSTLGTKKTTSEEKQHEINRIAALLHNGSGDPTAGKQIFTSRCATCHTLFSEGGKTGPDLTGYERRNLDFLLLSIIDPSAYVREEYTNFRIKTIDGQTLFGLISERAADHLTLTDSSLEKTIVPKSKIKDERALTTSIMPEDLLTSLKDQDLRDLFAYLSAPRRP